MSTAADWRLQEFIIVSRSRDSLLKVAIGKDWKGRSSPVLYLAAIGLAFWSPTISQAIYVFVALLWLIPDRRIEKALSRREA